MGRHILAAVAVLGLALGGCTVGDLDPTPDEAALGDLRLQSDPRGPPAGVTPGVVDTSVVHGNSERLGRRSSGGRNDGPVVASRRDAGGLAGDGVGARALPRITSGAPAASGAESTGTGDGPGSGTGDGSGGSTAGSDFGDATRAFAASLPSEPTGPLEPLVVASDLANPPFAAVDPEGVPFGRDVEMMQMLGGLLKRPIEWRRMDFDQLLRAAETSSVDVVCATVGITPERAERVAFTYPYFETRITALVRVGDGEPTSLDDLSGRRVSAGSGTTSERALQHRLPDSVAVLENGKGLSTFERLTSGDVDAAIMDAPAADRLVAESGGRLMRIAQDITIERYALVVPLDRPELLAELNQALQRLERFGSLESLDRAHGLRAL